MTDKTYIVGTSPVPNWVQRVLMPYRKLDGSTGYELHKANYNKLLDAGDVLHINTDGVIRVSRCDNVRKEKMG